MKPVWISQKHQYTSPWIERPVTRTNTHQSFFPIYTFALWNGLPPHLETFGLLLGCIIKSAIATYVCTLTLLQIIINSSFTHFSYHPLIRLYGAEVWVVLTFVCVNTARRMTVLSALQTYRYPSEVSPPSPCLLESGLLCLTPYCDTPTTLMW